MTKDEAIKFNNSGIWKDMTDRQLAEFQLLQKRLCMPFSEFHRAVESVLGRPVYTHEFANCDALTAEFYGELAPPTFEEIIEPILHKLNFVVFSKTEQ